MSEWTEHDGRTVAPVPDRVRVVVQKDGRSALFSQVECEAGLISNWQNVSRWKLA